MYTERTVYQCWTKGMNRTNERMYGTNESKENKKKKKNDELFIEDMKLFTQKIVRCLFGVGLFFLCAHARPRTCSYESFICCLYE